MEFRPKGRVQAVKASTGNTDVLRLLKVELKPKGRVKAVRASIGNTDVLRLLKVEFRPKGRVQAVRASIGKNLFFTKSLRLTKGFLSSIVTSIKRVLLPLTFATKISSNHGNYWDQTIMISIRISTESQKHLNSP